MKQSIISPLVFILTVHLYGQSIIELPYEKPDDVQWNGEEKEFYSEIWETQVVTNVSKPTMEVFRPTSESNTGTALIVAPGGGLYAHSIESEGKMVGSWLAEKGITTFVLKYRLVPTGKDGVAEISDLGQNNPEKLMEEVSKVMPYSVQDGLNAIAHVRENAKEYGIDPTKIGFMGFSAGGAVTMGVAYNYKDSNKPNFLIPVYAWTTAMPVQAPKEDAPPMLLICASDDPLNLAPGSIELYNSWLEAGLNVGLHMYSKGGHGFGMGTQGLPSDRWIERCYDWMVAEEIAK